MTTNNLSELTEDMRKYIHRDVCGGFHNPEQVIQAAVDVFCDNADEKTLRCIASAIAHHAIEARLIEQAEWPKITDCDRLDIAFAELNQNGIVSRQNFSCCGNCGVAEIGDEIAKESQNGLQVRGYTFYHMQDTESAAEGYGVCLNYGAEEEGEDAALAVGNEIAQTIAKHGLTIDWNGRWNTRIAVKLDWKRRFPSSGIFI